MARLADAQDVPSRRRRVRRVPRLLALALAALACFLQPMDVGARPGWCRADPTVRIGGRVGHITVSSYADMLERAKSPVRVRIEVPPGVESEALSMDSGFGHGYDVDFVTRRGHDDGDLHRQVRITVFAPVSGDHPPVVVDFEGDDGFTNHASGRCNRWIEIEGRF